MILLLDNYDSFTWNLYQGFAALGAEVEVHRNDALSVDAVFALQPDGIVLSPGPGRPADAGMQPQLLRALLGSPHDPTPLLGVCLGHQGLVEACGGELERDPVPVHGRSSLVRHDGSALFAGLANPFRAGRYHSLRARREALPAELTVTALSDNGHVMGVQHARLPYFGVQFHPESILTPDGDRLLANFLAIIGDTQALHGGTSSAASTALAHPERESA